MKHLHEMDKAFRSSQSRKLSQVIAKTFQTCSLLDYRQYLSVQNKKAGDFVLRRIR